jgi:hypothetical protein
MCVKHIAIRKGSGATVSQATVEGLALPFAKVKRRAPLLEWGRSLTG